MGSGKLLVPTEAGPLLLGCYKQDSYMGQELDYLIAQTQGPLILYHLLLNYCFNYLSLSVSVYRLYRLITLH